METKFQNWVKRTFAPHYIKEIEAFLNEATDRWDLEYRMNILTRRGFI
jgi:hypothetical protein